jgi:hypothetical protein
VQGRGRDNVLRRVQMHGRVAMSYDDDVRATEQTGRGYACFYQLRLQGAVATAERCVGTGGLTHSRANS